MCEYLFILLSYKFFIPPAGIHCILSGKSELVRKGNIVWTVSMYNDGSSMFMLLFYLDPLQNQAIVMSQCMHNIFVEGEK